MSTLISPRSAIIAATVLATLGGGLAGCGGTSAEDERLQNEEIAAARAQGVREGRAEERRKQQEANQRELKRELERLKKRGTSRIASTGSGSTPAPSPVPAPAPSSCGGGVSAGNSGTSCPFARNVAAVYQDSGGASTIEVYSPVTKTTYTMRCSSGAPVVCRGGNNAVVSIR